MTMPSWLAPTFATAEPKMKKFAQRIAKEFDREIREFWAAVPWDHMVEDRDGNKWLEAWFCLRLEGFVEATCLHEVDSWRKTISVDRWQYDRDGDYTSLDLSCRVLH